MRKASQSSRVIIMAFGSASTPLILLSSFCSDSKKCSAALGPRYSTGGPSAHHTAPRCSNSCKPHGVAFSGYYSLRGRTRALNLGGESLKVCIDDVRGRQLLVVVLKGELVLTVFRHLHPHRCLAYPTTVGSVGFQQILPCVAVQAALAEVLALLVLAFGHRGDG